MAPAFGIGALLLLMVGCQHAEPTASGPPAATPAAAAKEVVVVEVRLAPWPQTVRVQGSLLANEDSIIGSKLAGRVEAVEVDLGSAVKRGQTMVLLDRSELVLRVKLAEAQLQQACAAIGLTPDADETQLKFENAAPIRMEQAMVDEAQAAVNRAQRLLSTRAVTGGEYDTMIAQLKAAQARHSSAINSVTEQVALIGVRRTELALARQQLADAEIIAPFDGIVEQRRVSPGEYLQIGQPVVSLVRADRLRFTAGVPESKAAQVKLGQKVDIFIVKGAEPLAATVTRISPIVMQTSRAVRIEADVPNPDLKLQAGLFAEADVIVDAQAQALGVPSTAVSRFAGVEKVWLVADGKCRQQTVRTGREERGRIELLDGVRAGDQIVAAAADGQEGPVIAVEAKAVSDQLSAVSKKTNEVAQ